MKVKAVKVDCWLVTQCSSQKIPLPLSAARISHKSADRSFQHSNQWAFSSRLPMTPPIGLVQPLRNAERANLMPSQWLLIKDLYDNVEGESFYSHDCPLITALLSSLALHAGGFFFCFSHSLYAFFLRLLENVINLQKNEYSRWSFIVGSFFSAVFMELLPSRERTLLRAF